MRLLEQTLRNYPRPYINDGELKVLLNGTPNSRYGKVKRLLAQGRLLHIRRGLYCLTDWVGYAEKPHPFELAQYVYGPSYISFESALSYHQLIPEAVYTITNATSSRSKEFKTPLGLFSYHRLPAENLYTQVEIAHLGRCRFLMAKPWKAICDYVFCYKKDWDSLEPLQESLRMNLNDLPFLRNEEIQLLDEYYHQKRISQFLKGIG